MFNASKPDPRALMVMSFCVCLMSALLHSRLVLILLMLILISVMALLGLQKKAVKCLLALVLWILLQQLVLYIPQINVKTALSVLLAFCFRVLPILVMGIFFLNRIRINEFVIALERMHVPGTVTIPFSMACRFMPTAYLEARYISEAMKMRGLGFSLFRFILHPLESSEQLLIPLLIRSSKLSEELAASALCKGIEVNMERSSISGIRFDKRDTFWVISCLLITGVLFWVQGAPVEALYE